MKFSERYGHKPIRETIQLESMDDSLRNGLWSLLKVYCWDHVHHSGSSFHGGYFLNYNQKIQTLCNRIWFSYFNKPLDSLDNNWIIVLKQLRQYFFECLWYEVYDFIEFVANNYERYEFRDQFIQACNDLLEREMSAYRFVDGKITRITEKLEIDAIEQAIETSQGLVSKHLQRSLELLSDRVAPDYRNSIKESVSAVESLTRITLKTDKGTLGQLIKKLEEEIGLHSALQKAFSNLYGYTSDKGGIRHALNEQETVDFHDAKFILVACSAFVNFVKAKTQTNLE